MKHYVWDEATDRVTSNDEFLDELGYDVSWEYNGMLANGVVKLTARDKNGSRQVRETWACSDQEAKYKFALDPYYKQLHPNE
jgi:hypothetical protein